jgi:serine/threonine protein kinase
MADNTMTGGVDGGSLMLGNLRNLGGFELGEKLGEGGQGMVFRGAKVTGLESAVLEAAVKIVFRRKNDQQTVLRFIRECSMASRFQHKYAARVYQFGHETSALWVAMEFVHGQGLDRLLKATGQLPVEQVIPLIERVAEVVNFAHEQGMVHRDLKPANVMLAQDGTPKLLDFGIAKAVTSSTKEPVQTPTGEQLRLPSGTDQLTSRSGVVVGSPPYMAPESWTTPGSVDLRADLYALGVMTFELLAGHRPFRTNDPAEMMRAHLYAPVPGLDGFPTAMSAVLQRAMAKAPDDRHESALAFAKELKQASARYLTNDSTNE